MNGSTNVVLWKSHLGTSFEDWCLRLSPPEQIWGEAIYKWFIKIVLKVQRETAKWMREAGKEEDTPRKSVMSVTYGLSLILWGTRGRIRERSWVFNLPSPSVMGYGLHWEMKEGKTLKIEVQKQSTQKLGMAHKTTKSDPRGSAQDLGKVLYY